MLSNVSMISERKCRQLNDKPDRITEKAQAVKLYRALIKMGALIFSVRPDEIF